MKRYLKWVGLVGLFALLAASLVWASRTDTARLLQDEPTRSEVAGWQYAAWLADLREQDVKLYQAYVCELMRRLPARATPRESPAELDARLSQEAWMAALAQRKDR